MPAHDVPGRGATQQPRGLSAVHRQGSAVPPRRMERAGDDPDRESRRRAGRIDRLLDAGRRRLRADPGAVRPPRTTPAPRSADQPRARRAGRRVVTTKEPGAYRRAEMSPDLWAACADLLDRGANRAGDVDPRPLAD